MKQQNAKQKLAKARQETMAKVEEFAHSKGFFIKEKLEAVFVSPTMRRYADTFGGVHLFLYSEEPDGLITSGRFEVIPDDNWVSRAKLAEINEEFSKLLAA